MAELANILRKPAKTLNFLMAFGGGKDKAMEFLAKIDVVIDEVNAEVDALLRERPTLGRADTFQQLFLRKASQIYNDYHNAQPELKRTLWKAGNVVKSRGYVYTIMNRRSYIPAAFSYKAFNAVIQGSAADIFKERLIVYAPRYNRTVRDWGVKPFGVVHDDTVSQVPKDINEPEYVEYTKSVLEAVPFEQLTVPIVVNQEKHLLNWGE